MVIGEGELDVERVLWIMRVRREGGLERDIEWERGGSTVAFKRLILWNYCELEVFLRYFIVSINFVKPRLLHDWRHAHIPRLRNHYCDTIVIFVCLLSTAHDRKTQIDTRPHCSIEFLVYISSMNERKLSNYVLPYKYLG